MNTFIRTLLQKKSKGFTLVELLVASTIFSMVVVTATGALFQAQHLNTRVQQQQIILDGVNLSMESMVRDIRYGFYYHCEKAAFSTSTANLGLRDNCPLALDGSLPYGQALVFHPVGMPNDADRVAYYVKQTQFTSSIYKATCIVTGGPGCVWNAADEQITGDDVYIDRLAFFVVGANAGTNDGTNLGGSTDTLQPMATIIISGRTKPNNRNFAPVFFHIEHSTVSRVLDN